MSRFFPDAGEADESGFLCVCSDLSPDRLIDAYTHGIFPWPFPHPYRRGAFCTGWFSPDPRSVFEFDQFHVPRRLDRTCGSGRFHVVSDTDFPGVIRGCAERHNEDGTWITPELTDAYIHLHRLGLAHSVETWRNGQLAGGVYGVAVGGLFAAESMFYRERDASKVALTYLIRHLQKQGYLLADIQMKTAHTARFGAVEISRQEYLRRLETAVRCERNFGTVNSAGVQNPSV
ncbi:MAG: leucyl/phenylalanyl-tRNA--protein transferase [Planctomycetaceae bacterium]|jgi:leucyl/phenylalanyl-tRNA--protein transferase|nr:leucyl/phenylalanyl-tRNA--protein transferase [Planctomycetaceae bacterium]